MNNIIIISGLPRSGTSMMMKIIQSGGLEIIFDPSKRPDINNPNGYYEIKKVKDWFNKKGKVIKVFSNMLLLLPKNYNFDIIFMNRSLIEVSYSMINLQLENNITKKITIHEYRHQLQKVNLWINKQPNIRKIDIDYNRLLKDPMPILENIKEFLNKDLDLNKMKDVIDPKLYRNRIEDISKKPYFLSRLNNKESKNVHI